MDEREIVKGYIAQRMGGTGVPSVSNQPTVTQSTTTTSMGKLKTEEIQARQALLLKDRHLAQLHRDWVVQGGGLISEEEFWDTRRVRFHLTISHM